MQNSGFCAIIDAYYADVQEPIVVEKCRGWLSLVEMADSALGYPAKIIVPIRNVADVLASFEKLHRRQSALRQTSGEAENYFQFQTVEGRCEFWMRPDQPVGLAVNRIVDAVNRGYAGRMIVVPFDELTHKPATTVQRLYKQVGWEHFDHDFAHVEQVTKEDDAIHGFDDLHAIRSKIEPVTSDWREVLGPWAETYSHISISGG